MLVLFNTFEVLAVLIVRHVELGTRVTIRVNASPHHWRESKKSMNNAFGNFFKITRCRVTQQKYVDILPRVTPYNIARLPPPVSRLPSLVSHLPLPVSRLPLPCPLPLFIPSSLETSIAEGARNEVDHQQKEWKMTAVWRGVRLAASKVRGWPVGR